MNRELENICNEVKVRKNEKYRLAKENQDFKDINRNIYIF